MFGDCEDGHYIYGDRKDKHREEFIRSSNHSLLRAPIERHANEKELYEYIANVVNDVRAMLRDMTCKFSNGISEEDFVNEISKQIHIDKKFAMIFTMKSRNKHCILKYDSDAVDNFVGYSRGSE